MSAWSKSERREAQKKKYPFHRRFVRYTIRLWILVHAKDEYDTWTQNLSRGGICFEVPDQLDDGENVVVWIHLREKQPSQPIKCQCRIVWSEKMEKGYRHGGQFISFEDNGSSRLQSYLEK
jgi:hypothetical protein